MTAKWSRWRYLEARFVTILTIRFKGALVPAWPADRSPTRTGPVEADGAVDAQNAPTAPWKTLLVFHELPQGFPHPITHDKPRKSPESYWETRIDPTMTGLRVFMGHPYRLRPRQPDLPTHPALPLDGDGGDEGRGATTHERDTVGAANRHPTIANGNLRGHRGVDRWRRLVCTAAATGAALVRHLP